MRTDPPESGFLGAPTETDLDALSADVAILGVPHGWPYPRPGATAGCAQAPPAVRARSQRMARFRGHWDFDLDAPLLPLDGPPRLVDAGDVPGDPADGSGNAARSTDAVRAILRAGAVPICIGGDDSVPIPILRALDAAGPVTVVQVDAHLDYRDEVDGVREGYSSPMRRGAEMAHVGRIVHVGLRGIGSARPTDVADSRAAGNVLVTAHELHAHGVPWLIEQLADDARIFLAFDADGLDPSVAPAVSAPAPGGLGYQQALELIVGLGSRLVGAAFTELVPELDEGGRSSLVIARLMCATAQVTTR